MFLIWRQQADAPNHCSSSNQSFYVLLWYCCSCKSASGGCSAALRSLSHCLQFRLHSSRQLLCPSCHFVHYALRSASFHLVRSLYFCSKAWQPYLVHKAVLQGCTNLFASHPTILTGFHYAPLRSPFTSVEFSPPAANNFCSPCAPLRLRLPCDY